MHLHLSSKVENSEALYEIFLLMFQKMNSSTVLFNIAMSTEFKFTMQLPIVG